MRTGMILAMAASLAVAAPPEARKTMTAIVVKIQRADYEGDRPALASLAAEIAPYVAQDALASRARYWRGFALWRRAFNGFNETVDPKELEKDLSEAVSEFTLSAAKDPEFADAKVGAASCLFTLAFLVREDAQRSREYVVRGVGLMADVRKAAPDNPRFLWVQGGGEWYVPAERGGGHDKAFATYRRGIEQARKQKGATSDPLEPVWGEPELWMSLSWSHLNGEGPERDLTAAESEARAALAIVPNWHYVRDILTKQIQTARANPAAPPATTTPVPAPPKTGTDGRV